VLLAFFARVLLLLLAAARAFWICIAAFSSDARPPYIQTPKNIARVVGAAALRSSSRQQQTMVFGAGLRKWTFREPVIAWTVYWGIAGARGDAFDAAAFAFCIACWAGF
jgi:hypothetical protein